jgi:hypothetical protein
MDPSPRRLLQAGGELPVNRGGAPLSGYGFLFLNEPGVRGPGTALRLVLAPVYADAEYGQAFGKRLEAGFGLAGGGFAFSHDEIARGVFQRAESFRGHGLRASASLYPRLDPDWPVPLWATLRAGVSRPSYDADGGTSPAFTLPPDQWTGSLRAGLRLGGQEPVLDPALALEVSVWHETLWRERGASYGYAGDRELLPRAQLDWVRLLAAWRRDGAGERLRASVLAGTSSGADRLSAYRLGGMQTFTSEFPLTLPGYLPGELSASRFARGSLRAGVYRSPTGLVEGSVAGVAAWTDYLDGHEQSGEFHPAVSATLDLGGESRPWTALLGWGYGFRALRGSHRGAHAFTLQLQWDLGRSKPLSESPAAPSAPSVPLRPTIKLR